MSLPTPENPSKQSQVNTKRADVLIFKQAKQGRVKRESFQASQNPSPELCQHPQGDNFFETVAKVIDVVRANKSHIKTNLKSETNRLWGTDEDSALTAIMRHRKTTCDPAAPDHFRKIQLTSGQNSFKSLASRTMASKISRQKEEAKRWWANKVANERHMT